MILIRRMATPALMIFTLLISISTAQAGEIAWAGSYAAAVKEAKRTGRPIMIDFFADWCGWCKRLDADVYTADPVIKVSKKFISVKLNTETDDEGRTLAAKHQIESLPTILFVNASGEIVGKIQGYMPAPAFAEKMQKTLQTHQELKNLPTLRTQFDRSPNDLKVAAHLAQVYAMSGNADEAKVALERVAKLDPDDAKGLHAKTAKALAEMYVEKRDIKNAVPMFQEVGRVGKNAELVAYCRLSAAVGFLMMEQPRSAVAELMPIFSDPRMQEKDRKIAKDLLSKIPSPLW